MPEAEPDEWLSALAPSARFVQQPRGDLGDRIAAALKFALGDSDHAVLIGSDTPDLPRDLIEHAFEALDQHELVVGPAEDGGFYLLGSRLPIATDLFEGIEWSTARVCASLLENAARLRRTVAVLPQWADVDDLESLRALAARLDRDGRAPCTASVMREWQLESSRVR